MVAKISEQPANAQLVELIPNSVSATKPSARSGHTFNYDENGGFLIFGGDASGFVNSLWRYDKSLATFTKLDGSETPGAGGIEANKPTPRWFPSSWVGDDGCLWIYGGWGYNTAGFDSGVLGDTWKYDFSSANTNKWTLVTGSTSIDTVATDEVEGRVGAGYWRDVETGHFYLFAGYRRDSVYSTGISTFAVPNIKNYSIESTNWM